jgi:hypothetical protein
MVGYWVVMPCGLVGGCQYFGGRYCLHLDFSSEDGVSMFLWNISINLQVHILSQARRLSSTCMVIVNFFLFLFYLASLFLTEQSCHVFDHSFSLPAGEWHQTKCQSSAWGIHILDYPGDVLWRELLNSMHHISSRLTPGNPPILPIYIHFQGKASYFSYSRRA